MLQKRADKCNVKQLGADPDFFHEILVFSEQ